MNQITYDQICSKVPEEKLESIVLNAISNSRESFNNFYKKKVSTVFRGYSKINKVPESMFKKRICQDCCNDNLLANVLLSEWKKRNENLFVYVKEALEKKGYDVIEPDFNLTIIKYSILKPEDSLLIEDRSYVILDQTHVEEEERLYQTLASVLLGWFPSDNGEVMNENINITNSGNHLTTLSPVDDRKFTVDDFEELISQLDEKLQLLKLNKDSVYDYFDKIKLELAKDHPIDSNELNVLIDKVNKNFVSIRSMLVSGKNCLLEDFVKYITDNQINLINEQNSITLEEQIVNLKSVYENIKLAKSKELDEKFFKIYEVFSELEEEAKSEFTERIEVIKSKYLPNFNLAKENEIKEEITLLEKRIEEEINSYDLDQAISELLEKYSDKSVKYLCNYFIDKNQFDLFILLFLLKIDMPVNEYKSKFLANNYINTLCEIPSEYLIEFIKEDSLVNNISKCDEGAKVGALTGILLYLLGEKESAAARLYKDDLFKYFSEYPFLSEISNRIMSLDQFEIVETKEMLESEVFVTLNSFFNKEEPYINLISTLDKNYRKIIDDFLFPELKHVFDLIVKNSNKEEITDSCKKIRQPKYIHNLYKEAKTQLKAHQNKSYDTKITTRLQSIVVDLLEYSNQISDQPKVEIDINFGKEELRNNILEYTKDLDNKIKINKILDKLLEFNSVEAPQYYTKLDINHFFLRVILNSRFFNLYCPELSIYLTNNEVDLKRVNSELKNHFNQNNTEDYALKILDDANLFDCAKSLIEYKNSQADNDELIRKKSLLIADLEKNEKYLVDQNCVLPTDYELNKSLGRWKLCQEQLNVINNQIIEKNKRTEEETSKYLKELEKKSASLNSIIVEEEEKYRTHIYEKLREGLFKVGIIATAKKESKLNTARQILDEVERLRKFPKESIDILEDLLKKIDENDTDQRYISVKFMDISLIDLLKFTSEDDYVALGISKKQWDEISADRKEDIITLLENWEYLRDKPTTKDDIKRSKYALNDIQDSLTNLLKALAGICTLYKTNDTRKIGMEPLSDWDYSIDLPFTFTTKIISPRCSSLDKPIHFFVFTQLNTKSRKHIGRVKDFIAEKDYDKTGFNVFIVLDNKEDFISLNTYSATKNFPILGQQEIKRILFSVAENKLPKWELVFLLTLNDKILNIQPFKTQGLVDSNTGIFVGRDDIIANILNSQKDFAIYGGRRIGKSSLLSELRKIFRNTGHYISYQSFQGLDNSLTIAKSIIEDLKTQGLQCESLLQINTFDDFTSNLLNLYRENEDTKVVIILDELDELIHLEKEREKHQIIEVFRNISQKTSHKWRFIFAGYKNMYMQINGRGIYEHWQNPWQNFIDDTHMQLGEIESPRELIDEGLKDILGLEYEKEVVDLITDYSTGHPAFLQKFCECLIKSINNRISPSDRKIYMRDVENVFENETEFISYVNQTLDLNLSTFQNLISVIAAMEKREKFTTDWIMTNIKSWAETFEIELDESKYDLELELELLSITGVIKKTNIANEYRFSHPHFIKILNKLEKIDKDRVENLLKKLAID